MLLLDCVSQILFLITVLIFPAIFHQRCLKVPSQSLFRVSFPDRIFWALVRDCAEHEIVLDRGGRDREAWTAIARLEVQIGGEVALILGHEYVQKHEEGSQSITKNENGRWVKNSRFPLHLSFQRYQLSSPGPGYPALHGRREGAVSETHQGAQPSVLPGGKSEEGDGEFCEGGVTRGLGHRCWRDSVWRIRLREGSVTEGDNL